MSSLLYVLSLLINVQFRGDFGLMTDQAVRKAGLGARQSSPLIHSDDDSSKGVVDILEVPLGDLSLLLSPPTNSYGSRLHNIKVDLKEV